MNPVFIGCNGKATTLGRLQIFVLGASAQILTEINLAGSAHSRRPPPSPWRDYKSQPGFSPASLAMLVVVRVRRISKTVLARASWWALRGREEVFIRVETPSWFPTREFKAGVRHSSRTSCCVQQLLRAEAVGGNSPSTGRIAPPNAEMESNTVWRSIQHNNTTPLIRMRFSVTSVLDQWVKYVFRNFSKLYKYG